MGGKSLVESKTWWVNLLAIVVTILSASDVVAIIPKDLLMYVPPVLAALNIVLRLMTDKPIESVVP